MSNETILLIEDDTDLLEITAQYLTGKGYRVLCGESLEEGNTLLKSEAVSLILLDIMLPDGSGLDWLTELRQGNAVPVIAMTGLGENADVIRGLQAGADDYITKPCSLEVIAARIRTQLNKSRFDMRGSLSLGPLMLDKTTARAYLHGADMVLTRREFSLLLYLAQYAGQTLTTEQLYAAAWGDDLGGDTGAVRRQVSNLRGKLVGSGLALVNARDKGYCLTVGPAEV